MPDDDCLYDARLSRIAVPGDPVREALATGHPLRRGQRHVVVGRREWVRLPLWSQAVIAAKTDTGARSTSLHAEDVELFERNGRRWVRFRPISSDQDLCEAPLAALREVTSSNGEAESRPFVRATIELGPLRFETMINLTQRDQLRYPMLLGRTLLNGAFLVDPQRTWLTGKPRAGQ